jgi:Putative peptidoglycan binding domain
MEGPTATHGTLGLGASGTAIARIHNALARIGFKVHPEEEQRMLFGRSTERAVQAFQRAHRLNATGIADGATVSALANAPATTSATPEAANGGETPDGGVEVGGAPARVDRVAGVVEAALASLKSPAGEHVLANDRLVRIMRAHGVAYPEAVLRQCQQTRLPYHYACAMLDKESSGGQNVFGHNPVRPPQIVGGPVRRFRYLRYKRLRQRGHGAQGVGPCQLTRPGFQDRADALGGCHSPEVNMRVGFSILRALIRTYGLELGAARYNGGGLESMEYGRDFAERAHRWRLVLTT